MASCRLSRIFGTCLLITFFFFNRKRLVLKRVEKCVLCVKTTENENGRENDVALKYEPVVVV